MSGEVCRAMTAYLGPPWCERLLVGSLVVGAVRLRGVALPRRRPHVAAVVSLSLLRRSGRKVPAKRHAGGIGVILCAVLWRGLAPR